MDYVRRDLILKAYTDLLKQEKKIFTTDVTDALMVVPLEDVVPVRHGRWIWNPNGMDWGLGAWCCSECKSKAETWWANDKRYNPRRCAGGHFCGNCGADMREQEI